MDDYTINIEAGVIEIRVHQAKRPLLELLDFASRQNPKRAFLFVSKVLGKHIPVKPSVMRSVYDELANLVDEGPATYVVGMAETATGLGAGVADSLGRLQDKPVYYQHTTRHKTNHPEWLSIDECHSHAVDHIFYQPQASCLKGIVSAKRLVLVDDEITTGRTLGLLASRLLTYLPLVKEIIIVSLVNWIEDKHHDAFKKLPVHVRTIALLNGTFRFNKNSEFHASIPPKTDTGIIANRCHKEFGRYGMLMPYRGYLTEINGESPLLVIADGEHLYWPFLVAEKAENQGRDVLFQSSTRSPVMQGGAIRNKNSFAVDHRPVEHYIYNFPETASQAGQVVMMLEDEANRAQHQLGKKYPLYQAKEKVCV